MEKFDSDDFVNALSESDLKKLNEIADSVNEYMSYDIETQYLASIKTKKQASRLGKSDMADMAHKLYTDFVAQFHPIAQLTEFVQETTGKALRGSQNAVVLAENSLDAHNIANYLVLEKFRDIKGNFVGGAKSYLECVKDVNFADKKTRDNFALYLKLKHSLETISRGKQAFGNPVLESPDTIRKQIAKLDSQYKEFAEAAENLYEYQYNILKYYAVPSGLMTMDEVEHLHDIYPCYVPFYRVKEGKTGSYARGSFANQGSPIMRMKGSGLDTISPLESIITNTEKIVKASLKNQVAVVIANYADNVDGIGRFIEKVAPDQKMHNVDITSLKEKFGERLAELTKSGNSDTDNGFFAITELLDEVFGDEVKEFTPIVNASKKMISVMRKGNRTYYQVHDTQLFNSIAELTPKRANAILDTIGKVMKVQNNLITQFSVVFSASNPIRDIKTAYKLSVIDNPLEFTKMYVEALRGIITHTENYERFKAMGGGHSSELSATLESIAKTVKEVQNKDKNSAVKLMTSILNPLKLISSVNDFTESIPRFMEFQRTYNETGDLHSAIHAANNITTNFRIHGASDTSKAINSVFRFHNAQVQGLNITAKTFANAPKERKFQIMGKFLGDALLWGILQYIWNAVNDKEGYENLSKYKKNNFYNFAIGNGNFISLPKERENALLNSLVERTIDALIDKDEDAFYDFGGYIAQQLLPASLPRTLDLADQLHNWGNNTPFGGFVDVMANKDFRDLPIESGYDDYLRKAYKTNEIYDESTTAIGYWLGQTKWAKKAGWSPKQIDHVLDSNLGYFADVNASLFPHNKENRDITLGLGNRFSTDSNYSTDILNKAYNNRDESKFEWTHENTVGNAIEYEKNAIVTSYITGMNQAIKALPDDKQRDARNSMLLVVKRWNTENSEQQTKMLENLDGEVVPDTSFFTDLPSSDFEWSVNKQKYTYQMTPQEYNEYIKLYVKRIEDARKSYGSRSVEACEQAKDAVKTYMSKYVKGKYLKKATKA